MDRKQIKIGQRVLLDKSINGVIERTYTTANGRRYCDVREESGLRDTMVESRRLELSLEVDRFPSDTGVREK